MEGLKIEIAYFMSVVWLYKSGQKKHTKSGIRNFKGIEPM
jgi:hypothetical protein